MNTNKQHIDQQLIPILEQVSDPEIPVLSIIDLGVVHTATVTNNNVFIKIIPTYSGCPAMDVIANDIKTVFKKHHYNAEVNLVLSPAWTTDFITENGKQALQKYGVAPPIEAEADKQALFNNAKLVACTNCQSKNTKLVSQFGSTACKALFKCEDCQEPFDYFKCLK